MTRTVFVLTKAPYGKSESEEVAGLAIEILRDGNQVSFYLLSDAVLCAKQGQHGSVGKKIEEAIALGAEIYASKDELLSRGVIESHVIPGVKLPDDLIGVLVEDIMERAESVLSF